ncbi:uncharacterized protein LOC135438954 [Drosophila montana]|uniref:uncharacterized protein LOC135438954 n=1 Tax=Drosophila montana TaxID=40370 RepID=UPI00313F0A5A
MLFMESYLFCASVRLGVILISAFALIKSITILYVISTEGFDFTLSLISTFDINLSYRASYYMVRDTIYWLEQYPEAVTILLQIYTIIHCMSCIIAAYGAYKLKRYLVLPLAIFEFVYIVQIITLFVLFLRIVRHFVSLEKLILLTLTATAYAMLTVYDFVALLAFEQILKLVRSRQYQQLYGSDPFRPRLNATQTKHVNVVNVDKNAPKWWQIENLEPISNELNINSGQDEAHKHFQSQELLAEVLLRNAINLGYAHRKGF